MKDLEYRLSFLNQENIKKGPVLYWMIREQRVNDNFSLLYSQNQAFKTKSSLIVVFCLRKNLNRHLGAFRMFEFMTDGLKQTSQKLNNKNINFLPLIGNPETEIPKAVKKYKAGLLTTDLFPIRPYTTWQKNIGKKIKTAFCQIDSHNIVPLKTASEKQEYAAYTIRPKIHKHLNTFLKPAPKLKRHPYKINKNKLLRPNWQKLKQIKLINSVKPIIWLKPGEDQAEKALNTFIKTKLQQYSQNKNNPNKDVLSNLSPYLHFGQISSLKIALVINKAKVNQENKNAFLEELIIRKELADNFCCYNPQYDKTQGFPDWAQKTLKKHQKDKRPYIYSLNQLEQAKTHDQLWNASQIQMVKTAKMHGYLRMYWAKKILEWSPNPKTALKSAIYLNDKYSIDGRDPNGYTGISWSIGGVHDRPWPQRPVLGNIRYMSLNGLKRKFNVHEFINSWKNK
jgi:deoxyribodipyrimidine photo-lyase